QRRHTQPKPATVLTAASQDFPRRERRACLLLALADPRQDRPDVRTAGQLDQLCAKVLLQRPPGQRRTRGQLITGLVGDIADRDRGSHDAILLALPAECKSMSQRMVRWLLSDFGLRPAAIFFAL